MASDTLALTYLMETRYLISNSFSRHFPILTYLDGTVRLSGPFTYLLARLTVINLLTYCHVPS